MFNLLMKLKIEIEYIILMWGVRENLIDFSGKNYTLRYKQSTS